LVVVQGAFLLGVLAKRPVLVWCFCGVGVVICVADVEFWQSPFWVGKYANFFEFIFVYLLRFAVVLPDGPPARRAVTS
jgi:hypothetical protein